MRVLLSATALTPVALSLLPAAALAETTVTTAVTAPVKTSTAASGAPDSIRITSTGSVTVTTGNAVTMDSNHAVTNEGTVLVTGANGATGIRVEGGTSGNVTNSGKIVVDETYTPTDTDTDGDLDGPFAQGSGRTGIHVAAGAAHVGNILNSGTITIEGNQSAGIRVAADLIGSLTSSNGIDVLGDNSFGIAAGKVSGNVSVSGTVNVRGANSVGVALDGPIGGALTVQGTIQSTGYRPPTSTAVLEKLDADDLLQGGPALRIAGSVGGGILFDIKPADNSTTDTDEDDDGIPDAQEGNSAVTSFGAAPAVLLGSTSDINVGALAGAGGHGIVMKGTITADGVYKDVAGNGFVIGGLGGQVIVAGGMTVSGTINARSTNGNAVALRVGGGATLPELRNAGTIAAIGGGAAGSSVQAVLVDTAGSLPRIVNSGTIGAGAAGSEAVATAILDRSGGLTLIENSGTISAVAGAAGSERAVAIDLRANTSGATVRQTAVTSGPAPVMSGNILLGSGSDLLDIADGTVTGTVRFAEGSDAMRLTGDAQFIGIADFGSGTGSLYLAGTSRFTGTLAGSGALAVDVAGGTLDLINQGAVSLASLNVGAGGTLVANINGSQPTGTLFDVAGQASFAQGSKVIVRLGGTAHAEGDFTVLKAGTLTGTPALATDATVIPYLFVASLTSSEATDRISLNIRRKTATELGLNASEASAYSAVYAALAKDKAIEGAFLAAADSATIRNGIRAMLPDHAGGAFETLTQGSRATVRFLTEPRPPIAGDGRIGLILQQVGWGSSKDLGSTAAYDVDGWGATFGAEVAAGGFGAVGGTLSYLLGKDKDGSTANEIGTTHYEAALYWRGGWGGLNAFARGSYGFVSLEGTRRFAGAGGVERVSTGDWTGHLASASGGASYEVRSGRLTLRPLATLDYYRLTEGSFTETGGGAGFDLEVDGRTSDELAANLSLTLGYDLRGTKPGGSLFRVEIEGGRRELLQGELGATTARFAGGQSFTLTPEARSSGWLAKLRLIGGGESFRIGAEVNAEDQQGQTALAGRLSLQTAF